MFPNSLFTICVRLYNKETIRYYIKFHFYRIIISEDSRVLYNIGSGLDEGEKECKCKYDY